MPRIQILNLPDELIDGAMHNRFVLVLDEHPNAGSPEGEKLAENFDEFARTVGAAGGIISGDRVEILDAATQDEHLLEFDTAVLGASVAEAVRFHLESPEASDALRAWYERRRAAAGVQPPQVNHYHFTEPALDAARLEAFMEGRDKRQGWGRL